MRETMIEFAIEGYPEAFHGVSMDRLTFELYSIKDHCMFSLSMIPYAV